MRERAGVRREATSEPSRAARRDESQSRAREAQSSVEVRGNRSEGGRIERDRRTAPSDSRGEASTTYNDRSDRSRGSVNRGSGDRSTTDRRGTVDRGTADRRGSVDRGTTDRRGTIDRDNGNRGNGTWRDNNRNSDSRNRGTYDSRNRGTYDSRNRGTYRDSRYRNDGVRGRYGNRDPYRYSGRVSRVYPYGGGYRIWLTGCSYPFFVPSAYYHHNRFRVGLTIALGGYYNSRGFYDYYDYYDDYYGDRYYDARTSRGELQGVVESVDYRRETFVVRNDATGSFVTVVMRDRGRDPVRAGDYVELGGDWTRSGLFEAYRVDIVDYERRR